MRRFDGQVRTLTELKRWTEDRFSTLATRLTVLSGDVEALGLLDEARVTANQTGIGTSQTDLTNLAVTFTAVAGRSYRVTASLQFARTGGTPLFAVAQIKDTSGSPIYQEMILETPSTAYSLTVQRSVILHCDDDIDAGSNTIKTSVEAQAGGGNTIALSATANRPAFVTVEDIGPTP